jgi:hypothetical protein
LAFFFVCFEEFSLKKLLFSHFANRGASAKLPLHIPDVFYPLQQFNSDQFAGDSRAGQIPASLLHKLGNIKTKQVWRIQL